MKYSDWSLEKRFAFLSLITFILLGTVVLGGNLWYVKRQLVSAAARYSEAWTNSVIGYQFQSTDFSREISADRYNQLDFFFRNSVLNGDIKRVKVWNQKGLIIYSDERSIIGKNFPVGEDLSTALRGRTTAEFTDLKSAEQKTEQKIASKMLEVYIPIYSKDSKTVIGAFEIYIDDDELTNQVKYNSRVIIFSVLGSLIILYAALNGIVRKASSTISHQSKELGKLYSHLDHAMKLHETTQFGTIKALLATLNAKDNYTAGHSVRVADYSVQIGKKMGLTDDDLNILEESALFHDIGKIGIPETILNKPGKFTDHEYEAMKKHSAIGADIISSIDLFREHTSVIRHHHERIDGAGYPDGLADYAIPLKSKILAVADTYDALTSDRPYREGMSKETAIEILKEITGTQLDEEIVKFFLEAIKETP